VACELRRERFDLGGELVGCGAERRSGGPSRGVSVGVGGAQRPDEGVHVVENEGVDAAVCAFVAGWGEKIGWEGV
jgi:hypothetical protein